MVKTIQDDLWSGDFGQEYTKRNIFGAEELDKFYIRNYGISRTKLNEEFLDRLNLHRILEVGCNVGDQLILLEKMKYNDLWGIELQDYAVDIALKRVSSVNINIIKGSALDIPYKNNFFDLVFTSGLLVHISPDDIGNVLDEIYRCTNRYIWGFEYYTQNGYQMINYRGKDNVLWKTDFSKLFLDKFSDLRLVRKRIIKYKDNDNLDIMYLLKKV